MSANPTITAVKNGKKHDVSIRSDEGPLHVDSFCLSSADARERFAKAACRKYEGLSQTDIEQALLKELSRLETASTPTATSGAEAEAEPDPLAGTPQDVLDAANDLLNDPKLVQRISDDIAAMGVTGERELAFSIFLIGVSRLFHKPLAGIVQGASSTGKSYIVEQVARLFPPEALIIATQMTPQALFHMKPGSLVHRWVVGGERSLLEDPGRIEATRALREMLASQKLSKLMPVKGDDGIETRNHIQEGPIAFTETTTLGDIFGEDANRCLLLQTDESPEQTQRIIAAVANRLAGKPRKTESIVSMHHALQRLLPRGAWVRIPFAKKLGGAFTCDRVEVRRAFPQLLTVVQASALLHYKQRTRDDDGAILAGEGDYALARRLMAKPFTQSLGGGLSQPALDFLTKIPLSDPFTSRATAKKLKKPKSSVAGWLSELEDAGAVEVVEQARGRQAASWKRTDKSPDAGEDVLPSVKSLFP